MNLLQNIRFEAGLSLEEASRLCLISEATLMNYECGHAIPSASEIRRMADRYETTEGSLLDAIWNADRYELKISDWNEWLRCTAAVRRHAQLAELFSGSGGSGQIPCPRCKTGTIRYSVAAGPSGELRGACDRRRCRVFVFQSILKVD